VFVRSHFDFLNLCFLYFVVDERIVFCPVSTLQQRMYEEILKMPKCRMLIQLDKKCRCGS